MSTSTTTLDQNARLQKYGLAGGPLPAEKLWIKELDSSHFRGKRSFAIMAVHNGEATGANVYGDKFGARYNPERYRSKFSTEKVAKWMGKGYHEATEAEWKELEELGMITRVKTK